VGQKHTGRAGLENSPLRVLQRTDVRQFYGMPRPNNTMMNQNFAEEFRADC
jgi:hypothetical protein